MTSSTTKDHLFELTRQYASLSAQNTLIYGNISHTTIQDFLIKNIISSDHFSQYPPSTQYQKSFWKRVIVHLESSSNEDEDAEFELSPDIYERYLSLITSRPSGVKPSLSVGEGPPEKSFITYFWKPPVNSPNRGVNEPYLKATLLESRAMIEMGTTGLNTWTASFVLAQYFVDHPDLVVGRDVLEFGSGIGFTAIVLSSLQVLWHRPHSRLGKLWFTDVEETVLTTCQSNIALPCNLSSLHTGVKVQTLDWFASLDEERKPSVAKLLKEDIAPHVIIGADIVYDPLLIRPLLATLQMALEPDPRNSPICALFALTLRTQRTKSEFFRTAKDMNLIVDDISKEAPRSVAFLSGTTPHRDFQDVNLFRFSMMT
ncbi:hypothetical protein FA15DRAFT_637058 [Coprinopsis marcescibilis]|uniref:FAM86 N-terminal domain-containing protein n=1 Tax=Coprinopsis marcescibilis TaxID=230819 RepID=A0A5C3L1S0_COPMA|nr:hypothetical protein FA15DRAFT_637058 [Coprinopsis marcescibilis]